MNVIKTVKDLRLFISFILVSLIFTVALVTVMTINSKVLADDSGTVDFTFSSYTETLDVGDTMDVTISLNSESATQTISAFGFAIVYDSAVLQFQGRSILENTLTWTDVTQQDLTGTLKKILFTANAGTSGYSLGTTPVQFVTVTFQALTSGNTTVYLDFSNDRSSYDNYTSAVLLGGIDDISDHTISDVNNPISVTVNSSSNTPTPTSSGGSGGTPTPTPSSGGGNSPYPNTGVFDDSRTILLVGGILLVLGGIGYKLWNKEDFNTDKITETVYK